MVEVDGESQNGRVTINLKAPMQIEGLSLQIPKGGNIHSSQPANLSIQESDKGVTLEHLQGEVALVFS